jgi:hypothetical protein
MEKNRVIIVDYSHEKKNDNNVKKNDSINVSDIFSTFKKRYKNDVKEFKDTRKIKTINQFAYTFPVFYKKELKNSFYFFVL